MSNDTYTEYKEPSSNRSIETSSDSKVYSIARVFGYMFMWLAVTTAITFGLAFLFNYLLGAATTEEAKGEIFLGIIIMMIVAGLGVIVMTIVTHVVLFKGRHSIAVPAGIYATFMGILMGALAAMITYFYENGWLILGISFGVTTVIYGIMALIGLSAKSKLNGLAIAAIGLFMGLFLMSGVMIIIMIFFPAVYQWWYWILTLGLLAAVMLTTIWDIRNVKTLAEKGALNKNVSMYIAFNLYVDFIYILLRILLIVLRLLGKSK